MLNFLKDTLIYVLNTLIHNAPSLILGILIAASIKVYINPEKFKSALLKKANVSIPGSVAFGAFTPFCACGTMAVIVSMLTTALPWGPIMAFLTSSPLMSPDQFVMLSGIISPNFAIALALASIIIGLTSGYVTHYIEKNSSFLAGQARFADAASQTACSCNPDTANHSQVLLQSMETDDKTTFGCSCGSDNVVLERTPSFIEYLKLKELADTIINVGVKKILLYFTIFAAIGYFINKFVPSSLITSFFSADNILSVPLSAVLGLPLYVSGSSSIPLIKALMDGGASSGAMLAFMITGPGTSAGVITGLATIMKKKAIALYTLYILAGGILSGYAYDLLIFILKM